MFQYQNVPEGAFCVRMQTGACVQCPFEMVYNARAPLPYEEMQGILDELNGTINKALPPWLKALPMIMIAIGFVMFAIGAFVMVGSMSATGFGQSFYLPMLGFGLVAGGIFSNVCLASCGNAALSALRSKLNEINARYQGRGIDFDLHTSSHLELYTRSSQDHGRRQGVRTVMDYTLVVQNIQVVGGNRIPASHALANQALTGAGGFGDMQQPVQPNMQQPMQQQMAEYSAPPLKVAPPNIMPVAQAMAVPQMMTVTCPPGAAPGTTVQIQAPDGRMVVVQVPAGVAPGAQFQAQL